MLAAAPPAIDPSDPLAVVELKRQLQLAYLKIQVLEERLRLQRIQKYGPASEKLSNAQLELLEEEPGVSNLEVAGRERARAVTGSGAAPAQAQRQHPGRQDIAGGSAARGTSDRLHAGAVPAAPTAARRRRSSATSRANNWMWSRPSTSCW